MGDGDVSRKPVLLCHDCGDQVEPEERQVGKIFLVQGLFLEVGVNEPDAPPAFGPKPVLRKVGDEDIMVRADQYVPNASRAVDDKTHLPADLCRNLGQSACSLGRDDRIRGHLPAVEPLERLRLGGFEAGYVAVNSGDGSSLVQDQILLKKARFH